MKIVDLVGDRICRLKSWQVFVVLSIPFAYSYVSMILGLSIPVEGRELQLVQMEAVLKRMAVGHLLGLVLLLVWTFSIAITIEVRHLQKELLSLALPFVAAGLAVAYTPVFFQAFYSSFEEGTSRGAWLPILHLVVTVGLLFALSATATRIYRAERGKDPATGETIAMAVLLLLFPIGVWQIQPRVNKLAFKLTKTEAL